MLNKRSVPLTVLLLVVTMFYGLTNSAFVKPAAAQGPTNQWCKGVNIVFMTGGALDSGFATVVYNGALQASADLGPTTQYVASNWDPSKMITDFKAAVATHPDGIAVMGHPGDPSFKPLIDDAVKSGIIVTSQNTSLDKTEAAYKGMGFGYAGATLYTQGQSVGTEALSQFGLKEGDEVFVWGLAAQTGRGQRTKGVVDALEAAKIKVDYLEINDATNKDQTAGIPIFSGFMSGHPNVKAVITDHGDLTAALPKLLQAAGKKPGEIMAAGFDAEPASIQGIQDGWIGFVNDQQEWLQGYLPVLQICLTKKYGFSGLHVDTGAGFITKDNVAMVAPLVTAKPEIR
ncbi:MAG: substrate-binding domain-containing protein [Chloroflexota bacterium]